MHSATETACAGRLFKPHGLQMIIQFDLRNTPNWKEILKARIVSLKEMMEFVDKPRIKTGFEILTVKLIKAEIISIREYLKLSE
ncbi:hypothetical protein I1A_004242 [Pseudomonas fluorescens R124]|uniref:Uncharacterized protein n=1 Tax=Pseudomonas fluorescens R124 TaxID=743713 RepID=A0A7U9GUB8_PSEFL|nr:hypothetical protein I1A_004242 [Pseudomonas fluorescens R124]